MPSAQSKIDRGRHFSSSLCPIFCATHHGQPWPDRRAAHDCKAPPLPNRVIANCLQMGRQTSCKGRLGGADYCRHDGIDRCHPRRGSHLWRSPSPYQGLSLFSLPRRRPATVADDMRIPPPQMLHHRLSYSPRHASWVRDTTISQT